MSAFWSIHTPLPAREAQGVLDAVADAFDDFVEARGLADVYAECGQLCPSPVPPPPLDERWVRFRPAHDGGDASARIVALYRACRSTILVDHIKRHLDSPLQVTQLRALLERVGPCVIDWFDGDLQLGEDALAELGTREDAGPLSVRP